MYVSTFEPQPMGDRRHALGFLHLRLLGRHAKALVEVGVVDLHAVGFQLAQRLFALRLLDLLPRVQALTAATDDKEVSLVTATRVNQAVFKPPCPGQGGRQRRCVCSPGAGHLRRRRTRDDCPHKISSVHCPPPFRSHPRRVCPSSD